MTPRRAVLAVVCALAAAGSARGETRPAQRMGAAGLAIPHGVRAAAMGEAYAALSDDVDGIAWNPAGLARLTDRGFRLDHLSWFGGMRHETVSGHAGFEGGRFGLSAAGLWMGSVEARGASGTAAGGRAAASDLAVRAAYAQTVGSRGAVGVGLAVLSEQVAAVRYSGGAASLGFLWTPFPRMQAGAYVSNLGATGSGFPVPLLAAVGTAYSFAAVPLVAALEGRWVRNGGAGGGVGLEYAPLPALRVRAGLRGGGPASDLGPVGLLRAGLGYAFDAGRARVQLDYAVAPYGDLGVAHRFGVGLALPKAAPAGRPLPALPPPARLSVQPSDGGALALRWSAVPGAAGYSVYLSDSGGAARRVNAKPWAGTDLRIKGAAARSGRFSVAAVDSSGREGGRSAPIAYVGTGSGSAERVPTKPLPAVQPAPRAEPRRPPAVAPRPTVVADAPLAAPSGLAASVDATSNAHLTWSPVAGAAAYNVFLALAPSGQGGEFLKVTSEPVRETTYSYPVLAGTLYFAVAAVDAAGRAGPRSGEISVRAADPSLTEPPGRPAPPGEGETVIDVPALPSGAASEPSRPEGPGAATGAPSASPYGPTAGLSRIAPPSRVRGSVDSEGTATLRWDAVPEAAGYHVYLSFTRVEDGGAYLRATTAPVQDTVYTYPVLGSTALFAVTTVDAEGREGVHSKPVAPGSQKPEPVATATQKPSPGLAAPTGVRAVASKPDLATVRWNRVAGAVGYHVYVAFAPASRGGEFMRVSTHPLPETEFSYPVVGGGQFFAVTAVNASGQEGPLSREAAVEK